MSDTLRHGLAELGISASEEQGEKLIRYRDLVLENNEKVNLTAIREPEMFHVKHFLDSAVILQREEYRQAKTVIDVGTGGGFPGVPLAILSPEKRFLLMDSLKKRMDLVREMCLKCGVENAEVVHGRAEDLGRQPEHREQYDLCVSRAVADLAVLAEYCLPFVKVGGYFVSYKGGDASGEIEQAGKAVATLGGEIREVWKKDIFGQGRSLVIIQKAQSTPPKYPRKAGKPAKSPLR